MPVADGKAILPVLWEHLGSVVCVTGGLGTDRTRTNSHHGADRAVKWCVIFVVGIAKALLYLILPLPGVQDAKKCGTQIDIIVELEFLSHWNSFDPQSNRNRQSPCQSRPSWLGTGFC